MDSKDACPDPVRRTRPKRFSRDLQSNLTGLCALLLGISFVRNLEWVAYGSVAAGSYFALRSAFASLREREMDVNILMVLAAVGAIVVGQVRDAAALLFLFSLSSTLEEMAMAKTKAAIEKLVQLRPTTSILIRDGKDIRVPVESLVLGDHIRVPSFEKIPLDGEILEGTTSVDESALTGESVPLSKGSGMMVVAGTQNLEGTIVVRVTQTVGNSTLDRIIAMVQDAQDNKASGERLSQWFGQRYTIFVLVAFMLSWMGRAMIGQTPHSAFYSALILLVGLSPCALVISTPAATLSALANAARNGILVRGGEFIEKVAEIDVVTMDKTGTLTLGKPRLMAMAFRPADAVGGRWTPGEPLGAAKGILAAAADVERLSTHPLARAVVTQAEVEGLKQGRVEQLTTVPGFGISATIDGKGWLVGNDRFLIQHGFQIPDDLAEQANLWRKSGMTTVFASGAGGFGLFAFGDSIRPNAAAVVAELKRLGVKKVVMLTGDKSETAHAIAREAGVDAVYAELLPEDKTRIVNELSREGSVMMVGDGVNDAPSLALASVGVAMGGLGSDVALEAADVVLMGDNLRGLPELIRLGRRAKRIIVVNITFAVAVIAILAVCSFATDLPLPVAVLGHEGSTVLVILNGLRLLGTRRKIFPAAANVAKA